MGVDDVAAGSGLGSVVVVGEGDGCGPKVLRALSKGGSLVVLVASTVGSRPWSTPSAAVLSLASFSLSLFLFTGLVSTSSTERPLKADRSASSESSAASTGPCKGTEGTASGPGPGSPGAGIAGASGAVASVSSFFVSILALLAQDSPRRAGCTARGCCRHAEAVSALLPKSFKRVLSTLCFASPVACCWCRVPAAFFSKKKSLPGLSWRT